MQEMITTDAILSKFAGARVLITGGLGFIGSQLAARLVRVGANVLLVDSLIPEYGGNLCNISEIASAVQVNISDVRDPYSMNYLIRDVDYLFNLAGQTSHMDSMEDPETDLEINCKAQLAILEACRQNNPGIQRVVFASTRQIYGRPDYLPVDEDHPLRPIDVNGINKLAGEWYHRLYNEVYGLPTVVLRLTNTYGPCMRIRDARQTFLGIWIRKLLEGLPFEVWGGHQRRDMTFVDDAVDALLLCAVDDNAVQCVFNLGGIEIVTLQELAALLVKVNGNGASVVRSYPADRKRIDIGDYYGDYRRIESLLGWRPKVTLEAGLTKTLQYYQTKLSHYI